MKRALGIIGRICLIIFIIALGYACVHPEALEIFNNNIHTYGKAKAVTYDVYIKTNFDKKGAYKALKQINASKYLHHKVYWSKDLEGIAMVEVAYNALSMPKNSKNPADKWDNNETRYGVSLYTIQGPFCIDSKPLRKNPDNIITFMTVDNLKYTDKEIIKEIRNEYITARSIGAAHFTTDSGCHMWAVALSTSQFWDHGRFHMNNVMPIAIRDRNTNPSATLRKADGGFVLLNTLNSGEKYTYRLFCDNPAGTFDDDSPKTSKEYFYKFYARSSDKSVASINSHGAVVAKKAGKVTLTVAPSKRSGYRVKVDLTVK